MKNKKSDFYQWLKANTNKSSPSSLLDEKILKLAEFKFEKKFNNFWVFSFGSWTSVIAIFFIGNLYLNTNKSLRSLTLTDSPEMISIYDNVELMTEATRLSEQDWKKIEGSQ